MRFCQIQFGYCWDFCQEKLSNFQLNSQTKVSKQSLFGLGLMAKSQIHTLVHLLHMYRLLTTSQAICQLFTQPWRNAWTCQKKLGRNILYRRLINNFTQYRSKSNGPCLTFFDLIFWDLGDFTPYPVLQLVFFGEIVGWSGTSWSFGRFRGVYAGCTACWPNVFWETV